MKKIEQKNIIIDTRQREGKAKMLLEKKGTFVILSILAACAVCNISTGRPLAEVEDRPNPKVDYVAKINKLARAGRDENLNAAPYYKKAFELSAEWPKQISLSELGGWPKDLPYDKQILLQNWVSANGDALEQLELGTRKPYYWIEYQGRSMMSIELPELKQAKIIAHAICSRAKLNATKGNFKKAFSDLLVYYKFGIHSTDPKTLIEQLVATSIRRRAVKTAFQILGKTKPDPNILKYFQHELMVLSAGKHHVIDFTAERFTMYDNIQRVFTDDGKGGGTIPKGDIEHIMNMLDSFSTFPPKERQEEVRKWRQLERKQTTELANKLIDYSNEVVHKTPWQLRNEGIDLEKVLEEMTRENPFVHMITPNVDGLLKISHDVKLEPEALITTVALLRYNGAKGQFPATLQQLVLTGYLRNLPMDPYSDKPLVYKRTKDGFTLYSLGVDFDDDGGVPSKWGMGEQGGDQVFWPFQIRL